MSLTTAEIIKQTLNGGAHVLPFLALAEAEMRERVSDYNTVADDLLEETPARRTLELQMAETNLTLAYAAVPLGIRPADGGGYLTSLGSQAGDTDLLSLEDVEKIEAGFRAVAERLIMKYADVVTDEDDTGLNGVGNQDVSIYAI
jgi:hypothetical protein